MRKILTVLIGLAALAGAPALCAPAASAAGADEAAAPGAARQGSSDASSDKLRLVLDLLGDPDLRSLLERRRGAVPDAAASGPRPMPASMAGGLGDDLQHLRNRIRALIEAATRLPDEVAQARAMLGDMLGRADAFSLLLFLPAFVALGFGGEWLFRLGTRGTQRWMLGLELATVRERVSAVFARLAFGLGLVASYGLGSIGAFLLFDWTLRFKQVLLALLLASLFTRLAYVFSRFLLAPGAPRFRVLPMSTPRAAFLSGRMVAFGLLLGIGSQLITLLAALGFDLISQDLCAYALGLLLLVLAIDTIWRCPADPSNPASDERLAERLVEVEAEMPADVVPTVAVDPAAHEERRRLRAGLAKIAASAVCGLIWCFWVAGATTFFWILVFAPGLPAAVVLTQRAIRHVLRPTEQDLMDRAHRLEVIFLERGVRTLLIAGGAALLAHLIGLDVVKFTMQDTIATRGARAVLGVAVVLLVADFLWHMTGALIDRKLATTLGAAEGAEGADHAARLQTLLPILKNLTLAILAVVAGMMVLAALGVEIGPLIASAGVVGVAIGFGAQTLVKDIISGIFYLVDDAFRIGEYIQSGTYKGTVESFSLRSVKLRHQRGALYTIPFGTLGAVQNLSRDWVVDKIKINVPYETDLERVRKIVKRIGEDLAADPELGPDILKPIKLQGVAQFGDYALQLQTKMMTKPGDVQFAARRRALLLIKQEFQASGIGFALPTVQVSGEGAGPAAARYAVSVVKDAQASAAE